MLPDILTKLANTVNRVSIDRVSVIDAGSGGGNGVGRFIDQFPAAVLAMSGQIENATGLDIFGKYRDSGIRYPKKQTTHLAE